MTTIQVTEYTDPTCPFAFSAEPSRRRIEWLYGDAITLAPRMVGLHATAQELADHGFTTEKLARGHAHLAAAHHMPMITEERERLAGSLDACRAVVAVRLHDPARERRTLRALRVVYFAGEQPDEPGTLRDAAAQAGVDPDGLFDWLADPAVERALQEDLAAARDPSPAALALAHKLAGTDDGGHRYTCPSWELARDDATLSVPGFQPTAAYELAIANLAPELARRDDPDDVATVLRWAGEPLASAEVAAICGVDLAQAREDLARVAVEVPVAADGYWTLPG